jgi:hypothetical protein
MIRTTRLASLALLASLFVATPALAQDEGGLPPIASSATSPIAFDRNASGNVLLYRRVSDWEKRQIEKRGGLFVTPGSGESFVSTSRPYVDQLGARHPKDYANLMVLEVDPAAIPELEKIGLRASGPLLEKLYPKMPEMAKERPDAVHFKAELGALNFGLRPGSIATFNKYVKSIQVDKTARLEVPKEAKSIKQGERDKAAEARRARGLNSGVSTGPDADESDLADFRDHVARHSTSRSTRSSITARTCRSATTRS